MSRWERWTTKPNPGLSLNKFMTEAPMAPMASSDPKAEAERQGLEFAGFGWYRDPKTGKRVAKIEGDKLVQYGPDAGTAATTHTGNPTNPASGMTPADKARSMGLQSDGSGGYIDPSTGQVVAKTVNNELVFYDAQGGAISDGSGGEQLTQSAPSWVDPVTGLIIVPPAQPESPEELAAVPDSTPALAPMGLDAFFNKRKIELYRQQKVEDNLDQQEPDPQLGIENPLEAPVEESKKTFEDFLIKEEPVNTEDESNDKWLSSNLFEGPEEDRARKEILSRGGPLTPKNPGAPPRGYLKGHPQFKQYDRDLSAFAAHQAKSSAPTPAPETTHVATGSPTRTVTEPNPKLPGKPSLDSVLQDVRSEKPKPAQAQALAAAAPKLDVDGDGDVDREDVKLILGNLRTSISKKGKVTKPLQRVLDRLEDGTAGPRIKKFLGAMLDDDKRTRTEHKKLSRFGDDEGALRFLTEVMGLQRNTKGQLTTGTPNREQRALGGAGMPGEGRGEPRGFGFREIQSLLDPTRQQMLRDAQNDQTGAGARLIHRNALKNDVNWDMATRMYDQMDAGLQGKLNGWGKPVAEQGTFTPLGPVEYLKDGEGNFTGETNIDALARTDPEAYQTHFSSDNEGNRGRGIFNLMKHMAQGGEGEFSGLANFFDFDTMTPDHIMGRSSGEMPNSRAKDDPLNLAFDRRGLNQVKVSSQHEGERDTLESLLQAAGRVNGGMGNIEFDKEDYENMADSPNFMKFLAYRLSQKDFDPATIAQRGGQGAISQYPESIEELLDLDDDAIKSLVGKNENKNPLGLNMRNMAMRAPRGAQTPLLPNSWSGAPGGGLEYTPLTGYRRALLAHALFDPEMQRQLSEHEESLKGRKKPLSDEKLQEAMAKKRRDLVAHNLFGPQKAIGSLFGLGRINNEDFTKKLGELGGGRLEFLRETNPEVFERLTSGMQETLSQYKKSLDGKLPNGPFNVPDEDLMGNLDTAYMKSILGSNYGRSMMSPEIIKAFDAIEKFKGVKDNLVDDFRALGLNLKTML